MRSQFLSKIKSLLGITPTLITSDHEASLSSEFQQGECKCEQTTFEFSDNTNLSQEKPIKPSLCDTIDLVEKEMIRPYSLKPKSPVTQNTDGQINIPFDPYIPSIQDVVALAEKENLNADLEYVEINYTWEERLWHWADANDISDTDLPRNKYDLYKLNFCTIDLQRITKKTSLPKEIGNLINLEVLQIIGNPYNPSFSLEIPKEIVNLINLERLDLLSCGFTSIPKEIGNLTNLAYLNLCDNQLTEIPKEVLGITNLIGIDCAANQINKVSSKIRELKNLEYLNLSWNHLTSLPSSVFSMKSLVCLDLSVNQISWVLKESKPFTAHNLEYLYLSTNELTEFPIEICSLYRLVELGISCNRLTCLPPEIGRLTNLTSLNICWNLLGELPKEIGKLTRLDALHIYENKLTKLPEEMKHLDKKIKYLDVSEQNKLSIDYQDNFSRRTEDNLQTIYDMQDFFTIKKDVYQ